VFGDAESTVAPGVIRCMYLIRMFRS
jgi:hypothetical protein